MVMHGSTLPPTQNAKVHGGISQTMPSLSQVQVGVRVRPLPREQQSKVNMEKDNSQSPRFRPSLPPSTLPPPPPPPPLLNYKKMTCIDLRKLLRERNLLVSGRKADLIARLNDVSMSSQPEPFQRIPRYPTLDSTLLHTQAIRLVEMGSVRSSGAPKSSMAAAAESVWMAEMNALRQGSDGAPFSPRTGLTLQQQQQQHNGAPPPPELV